MSIEDRLCFITLLCLASSSDNGGVVKNCDEETLIQLTHLYEDPYDDNNQVSRARGCLKRYEALHCVTLDDNGDVTILNFDRRQGENLSNAERQKNYRERLKITTKKRNTRNVTQSNDSNARIDKNRIDKNTSETEVSHTIPLIIDMFKDVNPTYKKWYGNKTQRKAVSNLLERNGFEQLQKVIALLPKTNKIQYLPTITTPLQLEDKWASLEAGLTKEKNKSQDKFIGVA